MNDATVFVLVEQALNQARAGADAFLTYFAPGAAKKLTEIA